MLGCEVISDLMAVYASGEASKETRRLVEEHISRCSICGQAFGKKSRAEKILEESETREKPANGRFFINRTRRLLFTLGAGSLFIIASILALFERVIMRGIARIELPIPPGSDLLWLVLAASGFVFYISFLFWTKPREVPMYKPRFLSVFPLVILFFLIISISAYHLLIAGSLWSALVGITFVLVTLIATFSQLSRLPYFTLATILVLILTVCLMIGQAVVGAGKPLFNFALVPVEKLGHPMEGIPIENAAHIDMKFLGLELISKKEIREVSGIMLSPEDMAVQSSYKGNGQQAYVTFVRTGDKGEASKFYNSWKKKISTKLRLLHVDIIGHLFRSYNVFDSRAYNAWKIENWVIILEVPGYFSRAWPLVNKVRETVVRSFSQDERRQL